MGPGLDGRDIAIVQTKPKVGDMGSAEATGSD
jgi:hypothetical protein